MYNEDNDLANRQGKRESHMITKEVSKHEPLKVASRVSSRGQVVVPREFRKILGIEEGDHLFFSLDEDGIVRVEVAKKTSISQVFGALKSDKPFKPVEAIRKEVYQNKANEELGNEEVY